LALGQRSLAGQLHSGRGLVGTMRASSRPANRPPLGPVGRAPALSMRPRRIAVLGAGGFVGSHLVPRLAAHPGAEIVAVDRNLDQLEPDLGGVRPIPADLAEPGTLEDITGTADAVVSLTALCNPALYNTRPLDVIDAN